MDKGEEAMRLTMSLQLLNQSDGYIGLCYFTSQMFENFPNLYISQLS